MKRVSATQIQMFLECSAKWFYSYVLEIKPPSSPAFKFGSDFHEAIESEIIHETHKPEGIDPKIHNLISANEKSIKELHAQYKEGDVSIELEVQGQITENTAFIGFIDYLKKNLIGDFKTTSDWRYMKTEEELKTNVQMMLYAWWFIQTGIHKDATVAHYVFCKGGKGFSKMRIAAAQVTRTHVESFFDNTIKPTVLDMENMAGCTAVADSDKKTSSCGFYGGCPYAAACINGKCSLEELKQKFEKGEVMKGSNPFFSGTKKALDEAPKEESGSKLDALTAAFDKVSKKPETKPELVAVKEVVVPPIAHAESMEGVSIVAAAITPEKKSAAKTIICMGCMPVGVQYASFFDIIRPFIKKMEEKFSVSDIRLVAYNEATKEILNFKEEILSAVNAFPFLYVSPRDSVQGYLANNMFIDQEDFVVIQGII